MIKKGLVTKLLCVAVVAAVMLPLGTVVFPYVSNQMDGMQFQTLEAVLSTSLGFGIYALLG
jgi:hypothetical protein